MTQNGIKDSSIKGINGAGFLCGARIGIVAKPSPEFVAGVFGTWLSGGVAVPLALSYPEAELLHVMNDSVCFELITLFRFCSISAYISKMFIFLLSYYVFLFTLVL